MLHSFCTEVKEEQFWSRVIHGSFNASGYSRRFQALPLTACLVGAPGHPHYCWHLKVAKMLILILPPHAVCFPGGYKYGLGLLPAQLKVWDVKDAFSYFKEIHFKSVPFVWLLQIPRHQHSDH